MNSEKSRVPVYARVAIGTNLYPNEENTLGLVKDLGQDFGTIELELEGPVLNKTDGLRDLSLAYELKDFSQRTGVRLNTHAPYIGQDFFGEGRAEATQLLLRAAEFSNVLAAQTMTLHPGSRLPNSDEPDVRPQAIDAFKKAATSLSEHKKKHGFHTLYCLENMGDERPYLKLSADETREIIACTGMWLTEDVVHTASLCSCPSEIPPKILFNMPFVRNVHLGDMNFPDHIHLPLGEGGGFDFISIVKVIESTGYQGAYVIEELGGGYQAQDYIRSAKAFIEELRDGQHTSTSSEVSNA